MSSTPRCLTSPTSPCYLLPTGSRSTLSTKHALLGSHKLPTSLPIHEDTHIYLTDLHAIPPCETIHPDPMASQKPTLTFTTCIQPPPGPTTTLVLPTHPSASTTNPPIFNDAMKVRVRVFVDEQHCSADAEIDSDDVRSWQWVIYASSPPPEDSQRSSSPATSRSPGSGLGPGPGPESESASTTPVAVIRLVPPPQPPHELLTHPSDPTNHNLPAYDWTHEPCIKLTRVAVLPEYRGFGLGRRLVETALTWAAEHAGEIDAAAGELARQTQRDDSEGARQAWRGLVLVHAQVDVERMYSGLGFVRNEGLGRWDEEGIEHVGMFRRVDVR